MFIPSKATLKRRSERQNKQKNKQRGQGLDHVNSNHSIGQSIVAQMDQELKREVRRNRTLCIELDEQKILVRNLKSENLVLKTKLIEIQEKNKNI